MIVHEIHHGSKAIISLNPVELLGTESDIDGGIIDTAGYGSVLFFFLALSLTLRDLPIVLYESDDSGMSGATQIEDDKVLGNPLLVSGIAGTVATRFGCFGNKRYVRPRVQAGTAQAYVVVGSGILINSFHQPTVEQST